MLLLHNTVLSVLNVSDLIRGLQLEEVLSVLNVSELIRGLKLEKTVHLYVRHLWQDSTLFIIISFKFVFKI